MAIPLLTLEGNVNDAAGGDVDPNRCEVWMVMRDAKGLIKRVADPDSNEERFGNITADVAADGTYTFTDLWPTNAATNPTGWYYEIFVKYPLKRGVGGSHNGGSKDLWSSGPFQLTASGYVADQDFDIPVITATWRSAFADDMEAIRVETETIRTEAEAARDQAVDISNIDTTDDAIDATLALPGSKSAQRLTATIATMTPLTAFGSVGDGVADDSPAFAAARAAGAKAVYVPAGTYRLTESFAPAAGTTWTLDPKAKLVPASDFDVVVMSPQATVQGGFIDATGLASFTSAGVLFEGTFSGGTNHAVKGMTVRGPGITSGAAIRLATTTTGSHIDWVLVKDCYLTGFERLIHLDSTVSGAWINANVFDSIVLGDAEHAIYVDGDGVSSNDADGNFFRFTGQAGIGGAAVIYNSGDDNTFEGFCYDIAAPGLTPLHAIITKHSRGAVISGPPSLVKYIRDNGTETVIRGKQTENTAAVAFEPVSPFSYAPDIGAGVPLSGKLVGNQDDWLAYSVVRHTITQTAGAAVSSGSLNNINNPDPSVFAQWSLTSTDPAVVIEWNLSAEKLVQPRLMGLVFEYGRRPKDITVTVTDDTSGVVQVYATTDNDRDVVTWSMLGFGVTSVSKITVTLGDPKDNAYIRLARFWAVSGNALGQSWLPAFNPTMRGVFNVRNSYFGAPSAPTGGGVLYGESGAGRWRSSGGTIQTFAGDVVSVGSSNTLGTKDKHVLATGGASGITVTLPAAVRGSHYIIKKVDAGAGAVTIATTSSQTIDGATTKVLAAQWEKVTVVSDGTAWFIV